MSRRSCTRSPSIPSTGEAIPRFTFQLGELGFQRGAAGLVGRRQVGAEEVVSHVEEEAAERRGDPRVGRDDNGRDVELAGQVGGVNRARAAEGDEAEIARVVAAADRDQADGIGHVRVGDLDDGVGGAHGVVAERRGDLLRDGSFGGVAVERHGAAEEPGRAEPAEDEVGVGVGRLFAAALVGRRTRVGAHALRPVAQAAARVDPGDAAAAGADGDDLDRGEHDRVAELDRPLVGDAHLTAVHQRDVGAGAAHVEADGVVEAALAGEEGAGHGPRCRAGDGDAGGVAGDRLRGHDAAAGVEDEDVAFVLAIAQAVGEIRQVAADDRRQAGVDDRRAEALVLEDLGQDLVGGADEDARRLLLHDRLHARLVLAVHVGVDEGDRRPIRSRAP